jgi:deoxyribodipyrimidine photo-lyase
MDERVRPLNSQPIRSGAPYVLYWMRANRRVNYNHALAFASEIANAHNLPLLCYESLEENTTDRLATFVLEGVPGNARCLRALGAGYVFSLSNALARLAADAACLVTDDFPTLAEPAGLSVASYAVDSSCIVPMSQIASRQYAAYAIRPKLRKLLPRYLRPVDPIRLRRGFPDLRFEFHTEATEADIPALVASQAIDHGVPPSISFRGGAAAAESQLGHFLDHNLRRYAKSRNEPAAHATSGLSPYLHFGHISALEVALRVRDHADRHKLIADEFLEQLIVRRELAFNFARYAARLDSLSELPDWARQTLAQHAQDPRPALYSRDDFVHARTADPLWNATQQEMLRRGIIHGYYRMYWGKKLLEWSASCPEALATAIHILDRFALDGRDPNTYANILWCFGLHDRPWPERPVFGMVRSMTRAGLERKTDIAAYLREVEAL